MRKLHELKIIEPYTSAVKSGIKTFEIRENDRNFKIGDTVLLKPYDPVKKKYLIDQESIFKKISYITDYNQKNNYVVMSLQDV